MFKALDRCPGRWTPATPGKGIAGDRAGVILARSSFLWPNTSTLRCLRPSVPMPNAPALKLDLPLCCPESDRLRLKYLLLRLLSPAWFFSPLVILSARRGAVGPNPIVGPLRLLFPDMCATCFSIYPGRVASDVLCFLCPAQYLWPVAGADSSAIGKLLLFRRGQTSTAVRFDLACGFAWK